MDEGTFVPQGIDQDSWLGFEQRIQERRAQALADTARSALDNGDHQAAREALAEARALNPEATELIVLERRLAEHGSAHKWKHVSRLGIVVVVVAAFLLALDTMREPVEVPPASPPVDTSAPVPEPTPAPPPAATSGVTEGPGVTDPPAVTTPAPAPPVTTSPGPTAPPTASGPAEATPPPEPVRPSPAVGESTPALPVPSTDEERVMFALRRYGRTFTGHNFADCAISLRGNAATAVCRTAGALPIWDVELSRHSEGWVIESAVAREK